jgi:hypothetical protein
MSGLANAARGEVALDCRGRDIRLCVTLGGLVDLETAFGVSGFVALANRLRGASMADLVIILTALAHEHGKRFTAAQIAAMPISPVAAALAVACAFELAFGDV